MIKGVIFDMDGVLIDSAPYQINAEVAVLKEYGVNVDRDFARDNRGMGVEAYFALLSKHYGVNYDVKEVAQKYRNLIDEYYKTYFPLVPHVRETLAELKTLGILLGLGTSSRRKNAEGVLSRHGVWEYFSASTCGDDVARVKPEPDIFLATMEKLGLPAEEAVVVEDSLSGFQAAKAAGAILIGRRAGHNEHLDFSLCDFVIDDLMDLTLIIKKL